MFDLWTTAGILCCCCYAKQNGRKLRVLVVFLVLLKMLSFNAQFQLDFVYFFLFQSTSIDMFLNSINTNVVGTH